jgi:protein phosphatase slingshot
MVRFIDEQRKAGRTVFIHCRNGVSRSGMVATAYLMSKNNWSRDEALKFIRSKRDIVRPNPAFMKLLEEWEGIVKDKPAFEAPPRAPQ